MRERHNIVGTEVGHARPPVYFRTGLQRRPRRRGGRALLVAAVLLLGGAGIALARLEHSSGAEEVPAQHRRAAHPERLID